MLSKAFQLAVVRNFTKLADGEAKIQRLNFQLA